MQNLDRFNYAKLQQEIRNSNMDDAAKYDALYEAEKEFNRQEYIRSTYNTTSENNSHSHNTTTGCLIVMGFMTAFAGLSGIAAAKTISNAIDTKQPEGPKATLVSKSSVQKPKNLASEHTKD